MKQSIITAMAVGLVAFMTMTGLAQAQASNQIAENQAALLKQVTAEVKQLRLEVIQQAIEFQNWKIQWIEREIEPIRNEQRQLREQEQTINQLTADLEKHASNATPGQEGMTGEMEALKTAYTEKGLKELSSKQQLTAQREMEMMEQLEQEQQRLQELTKKAKQLRAEG